nr:hypothetical protein [Tanacetum cinerariifolium]
QTSGSGNTFLQAVAFFFRQWKVPSDSGNFLTSSGNALSILFPTFMMYQMDVKNAFLYGTIEEEAYVCQPLRFKDPVYPDKVYKVVKALYGLHQAPRAWYETLANYLLENGFRRGKINQTLFIKKQKAYERQVPDEFKGELTFFLGLQVKQKKDGIFISQDKYVAEILRKFGLTEGKSASTPTDTEKPLLKDPDGEDVDVHTYRSLMYLTSSISQQHIISLFSSACNSLAYCSSSSICCFFLRGLGSSTKIPLPLSLDLVSAGMIVEVVDSDSGSLITTPFLLLLRASTILAGAAHDPYQSYRFQPGILLDSPDVEQSHQP